MGIEDLWVIVSVFFPVSVKLGLYWNAYVRSFICKASYCTGQKTLGIFPSKIVTQCLTQYLRSTIFINNEAKKICICWNNKKQLEPPLVYHRRPFSFLLQLPHPPLLPPPPRRSISKPFNINVHFRGEERFV